MDERFDRHDYDVRTVPLFACQRLVADQHYSGGGSNTATYRHGLVRRDNTLFCLGIAWWIPPTRSAAEASWDGDWHSVLSLSRLVVDPSVPRNGESFLIAHSIKLIEAAGIWRCLVTYADTWQGHTGTIYKATGWEYMGLTKPEPIFCDGNGRMVARKAGPVTRTRAQMEALGYHCVGAYPRHKFRKILPEPKHQPGLLLTA